MHQRCSCRTDRGTRWPRHDFNLDRELCRTCALRVVPSGSRWSPFLCGECKSLARTLNERAGMCVVPIGRHSLMNGVGLGGGRDLDDATVEAFTKGLSVVFGRVDRLTEWRRRTVAANRALVGLDDGVDVPLETYVAACASAGLTSVERFDAFVEAVQRDGRA